MTQRANAATSAAFLPSALVRIAVHAVPHGVSRNRYRAEFLAELHGMPRGQQIRYASGVLAHAMSLRNAVTAEYLAGATDMTSHETISRPILCRVDLHHTWQSRTTEDGGRYRECLRCGKIDDRTYFQIRSFIT